MLPEMDLCEIAVARIREGREQRVSKVNWAEHGIRRAAANLFCRNGRLAKELPNRIGYIRVPHHDQDPFVTVRKALDGFELVVGKGGPNDQQPRRLELFLS